MIKRIIQFIKRPAKNAGKVSSTKEERLFLEKKVEQGTDLAIKEYSEVFKMLEKYDRT